MQNRCYKSSVEEFALACDLEEWVNFSYREGRFRLSVSNVMKAHVAIPRKKDASAANVREGLEIWRWEVS